MIKKLRFKFILISMISMISVLLIILLSIILINYHNSVNEADRVIDMLVVNDGKFDTSKNKDDKQAPDSSNLTPPSDNKDKEFDDKNKETPFETRYFSITINNDTYTTNLEQIASVNETEAINMANSVKNKERGFYSIYRYRVEISDEETLIIFVDCRRSLESITNLILTSLWISFIGIVAVFILVFLFSKKVFKPVENSIGKQKMFITNASHELKTPLTIISANNELIELEYGDNEYVQSISKQISRMTSMVNNLTSLAKLDENKPIKKNEINISSLSLEIVDSFINVFESNNKKLEYDIDDSILYQCDSNLISQMIYLLLDNSNKYSISWGFFSVKKNNKIIEITSKNDSNLNMDNGDILLERFYRATDSRNNVSGSGIGLSLVNEIVNHHKGSIKINTKNNLFECIIKFKI